MNKPLRQCVGCRQMKEKSGLLRVVRTKEGLILTDKTGKINGRGAYICPDEACFALAKKNHGLSRTLRVNVDDDIFDGLSAEIKA